MLTQQSGTWRIWIVSRVVTWRRADDADIEAQTCWRVFVLQVVLVVCSWRHGYQLAALCIWQFSGSGFFEHALLFCITVSPTCFVLYSAIVRKINIWEYLLNYLFTYILSHSLNSMEQNPSFEANQFSASQENPPILWNPKVHYRGYIPPPVTILSPSPLLRSYQRISPGPSHTYSFRNRASF